MRGLEANLGAPSAGLWITWSGQEEVEVLAPA